MRLVEDHRPRRWQDLAEAPLLDSHVGEEEVMIYHQEVRRRRPLLEPGNEAGAALSARRPRAVLLRGADSLPEG